MNQEKNLLEKDIKELEDELADARVMVCFLHVQADSARAG